MLKKQFFISFSSVLIIGLIGVISIPILTRLLAPEEIGKLFIILAIVSILQVFDGFKPVITFFLNRTKLNEVITLKELKTANNIFIIIISFFLFIFYYLYSLDFIETLFYVITFIFYSLMSFYWSILDTKNQVNFTSISRTLGWLLAYSFFIIFAYFKIKIEYYIISILFMYLMLYILYKVKLASLNIQIISTFDLKRSSKLLRIIINEILNNIKIQVNAVILVTMDKFIVPFFTGYTNFAYYAIQSELATKTYLINATWKRVLYPYLAKKEKKESINSSLLYLNIIFSLSLILCIIIGLYSKEIISLYAGKQYAEYSNLFSFLILVFPFNILGTFGVMILQINGNFKLHYSIYRNFAILNLIVFSLLTYYFGILGSSIALLLSRSVDLYLYLLSIKLYIKNISYKVIVTILFLFLIMIIFLVYKKILFTFITVFMISFILFMILKKDKKL
jgi:O-antigen/teichoic acid export membrane protein